MNATVAVRAGDARDVAFLIDLGRRVAQTSVSPLRPALPLLVEASYEQMVDFVLRREHDVWVAEESGVRVGFVLVVYDLPDEVTLTEQAFVAYMAVEPAKQRRGVGRALLEQVERAARARGFGYVALNVTVGNRAAQELYARVGFRPERQMLLKPL